MNKSIEIARRNLIYLVLLLPIIIFPFSSNVFELSRTLSIGIYIGMLGSFLFLVSKLTEIKLPNKFILIYFLFYFFSNLLSIDRNLSILGDYSRFTEGNLVALISFFYLMLILNFGEKIDHLKIAYYSSIPISILALLEAFQSSERVSSTFGQPNFLGIFITLIIIYQIINFEKIGFKTSIKCLIFISQIFILVKSASLTAVIALLISIIYLLIIKKIIITKTKILISALLISIFVIWQGDILYPKIKDIYFQLVDRNQTSISDSLLIRFAIWETSKDLIFSSPKEFFLGHGSNTFVIEFEKNRNNKLDNYSEYYLFYDKPHNYFIEILYSNGIFTLILFLYIVFRTLAFKREYNVYLITILIFIFFNWLDIYSRLLFFVLISQTLSKEKLNLNNNKLMSIFYLLILIICVVLLSADYRFFKKDYENASRISPTNELYKSAYLIQSKKEDEDFFNQNRNPIIKIYGLRYFQDSKLEDFKLHLLETYPNNRPIKLLINNIDLLKFN